ncbi:MAG: Hpt domain-containing protein [Gemmatimonadota bacterium]
MDELKAIYRRALPAHAAALEAARDTPASELAHTARRIAHSLRGSGGTYGFPQVTAAAAAVEDARDTELLQRIDDLIALLHRVAGEQG